MHCSPLGLVEKKEPGEYRLIHHLSFPEGISINDAIPEEESFVQYSSVNDAIDLIKKCGRGAFCAKTDIKSAFRLINLSQSEFKCLGFVWQNQFYFDCCLPFGLSSSCKIFERFSTALQWCAQTKLEIHNMTHVLDDFIIVESSQKTCNHNLALFLEMCKSLGVPIADEKTVEACQVITFLGIELDTINMEARLPDEKVQKCKIKISEFLTKSKVTLRELQSLIGLLNFACNVVIPGRPFLRRLINLTIGVSKPFYKVRLTKSAKLDLSVWLNFLKEFNGKCLFLPDEFVSSSTLKLYTDASGTNGYAAVFGNQWFCGQWDVNWANKNIAVLELYPIVIAVEIWSQFLQNKSVLFNTDNMAIVHVINKQTAKDNHIMYLIRRLVLVCLKYNIQFKAQHLTSKENLLCDCLSRSKVQLFHRLAPWADSQPVRIPPLPPYPS
ncbi:hypothetical protein FSP39_002568 [Pinctada imbricata]|uniref:Reverse transcriptase domain-containing protein n=1 Tax=Pinctada imbricata TaxID=66713 RepID=A0AA89BYL5_PINIB|nr:hypothetical protein FSP39_002568 [Pinctada imbricata]